MQERKTELLSHYKFTFTFENSQEEDYVTEKVFDALVAGSVPGNFNLEFNMKISPHIHFNLIST